MRGLRRRFLRWLSHKARETPTVTPEQMMARQDFIERVEQERQRRKSGKREPVNPEAGEDHELRSPHPKPPGDE